MHTTAGLQLLNIIDDGSDECVWMDKAVAAIEAEAATLATTPDALDVERHTPWARAIFVEQRLWLACYCGFNVNGDATETWNDHLGRHPRPARPESWRALNALLEACDDALGEKP